MFTVFLRRSVSLLSLRLARSTHQSPRFIDHRQLVMKFRCSLTIFPIVGTCEDFFEGKLPSLIGRRTQWMCGEVSSNYVHRRQRYSPHHTFLRQNYKCPSPIAQSQAYAFDGIILLVVARLEDYLLVTEGKLTHFPLNRWKWSPPPFWNVVQSIPHFCPWCHEQPSSQPSSVGWTSILSIGAILPSLGNLGSDAVCRGHSYPLQ